MPFPICTEDDLVQRLRRRDESAMKIFYNAYARTLYGVILRLVRQPAAAEDVLQDCMVKIWHAFPQYDASRGRLYTWALNLTKHAAIDYLRAQRSRGSEQTQTIPEAPNGPDYATQAFRPEHIGVADVLHLLRPEYRRVIELLYFGGCTQVEAAEELNLPLGTVKTHKRQALMQLAKLWR